MSTRVYFEGATVAHYLHWDGSPNNRAAPALCGRAPWPGDWFGTGTQDEEEEAAGMPLCVRCQAVLNHQSGGFTS